jgi:hypothetical protein
MSREKELDFFVAERNWNRGIKWYKSNFRGRAKIYGESSPNYTNYPTFKNVPERIFSVLPNSKLLYIVRNPIERILSNYIHNYANGTEQRSIDDALSFFKDNPYLERSKYFMQISRFLKKFPLSNIFITSTELFKKSVDETMFNIFTFVGVDPSFSSVKFNFAKNTRAEKRRKNAIGMFLFRLSKTNFARIFSVDTRRRIGSIAYLPFSTKIEKPKLNTKLKIQLMEYFCNDINDLEALTGLDLSEWQL